MEYYGNPVLISFVVSPVRCIVSAKRILMNRRHSVRSGKMENYRNENATRSIGMHPTSSLFALIFKADAGASNNTYVHEILSFRFELLPFHCCSTAAPLGKLKLQTRKGTYSGKIPPFLHANTSIILCTYVRVHTL